MHHPINEIENQNMQNVTEQMIETAGFMVCVSKKNDFNLKFEIFFDVLFLTLLQIGYEWKLIALL